ncbi:MAG: ABC transporter substrate-binding protein [Ruminiclostridium sp.]|nr:ABC transporter substrate-binding protein [Ruminiclostridium sp.]
MKIRIKYIVLLIFALTLFFTSCSKRSVESIDYNGSSGNKGDYIEASFIKDINRSQIAVGENGDIYLTDEYRIYILDSEGNEKKQIVNDKQRHYKLLAAYDGGFFAYGSQLEEYNTDGILIKKHNLAIGAPSIEKMLYMDGKLFISYHIGDNEKDKYLAEYNLADEELKEIDIELVRDFVEYKDKILLVFLKQDCCNGHMLTYNIQSGEKSNEIHIPYMPLSLYPYYNTKEDQLYLLSQGTIKIVSLKEKKMVEAYTSSTLPKSYTACYGNNMAYCIDREQKKIVSLNIDDISSSKIITVLCNDFASDSSLSRVAYEFDKENNGTGVKFIKLNQDYVAKLNTMLLSGDDSFDLYMLSTYDSIPSYYMKKGVYEDLNNYPVVSRKFDDMFEGIKKLCTYNGTLLGVPIGLINSDTVYQLNTGMLEKFGLKMPEYDWTWSDFEKYAEDITSSGSNYMMQQSKIIFWLCNIYAVSNCTQMDLTKEAFNYGKADIKNELEFVKRIYEKRFILEEERVYEKKDDILLNFIHLPSKELGGIKIIPAPVFNDKRVYPFMVNYLCLNKASKNKQLAAEFLGKCMSKEAQSDDLITQGPILYKDKAVYKESIYKNFITDDWNYNVYCYMLKNSYRNETYLISREISDYIKEYFEGRISSDEAAEAIYNKMKQVVEE